MMRNWKIEGADHAARQKKASEKIDQQGAVVKSMNGHAVDEPSVRQTLTEMQVNKTVVDLNRALFDYDKQDRDGA